MYTVPIIPPDLRHEETIIQAALALDCLQKTINSVFVKIDKRISVNNEKVQALSTRIEKAQTKIKSLVGTKKAIQIYSPARFPSSQVFHDIPLTFNASAMSETEVDTRAPYEVKSRVEAPTPQALQEKLVFFHVRTIESKVQAQANQGIGLGAVPEGLRSVNSLLLQHTDESAYGAERLGKDTWKRAKLFKNQRDKQRALPGKQQLEPAPHSLANWNQKATPSGGLKYTPRLDEAPEIDVPLDLPDLPGIADDIHFEGQDRQQIAPSLYIENLTDLPDLPELDAKDAPGEEDNINQAAEILPVIVSANIPNVNVTPTATSAATPSNAPLPPPPPPPPAPPAPSSSTANPNPSASHSVPDARSELMDAIRKAGGARLLRSTAAAPVELVANAIKSKSTPKPANLMDDLHNKLLMRRKGISGAKGNQRQSGSSTRNEVEFHENFSSNSGSVISRLSALIPAPPPMDADDDDEDENATDNDWTD